MVDVVAELVGEDAADQRGFQTITEPAGERLVQETVAPLEPIAAEPREGKGHEPLADGDRGGHGGDPPRESTRDVAGPVRDGRAETDEEDHGEEGCGHAKAEQAEDELQS